MYYCMKKERESKLKNICNVNVTRIARKRKARKIEETRIGECITPIRYNIMNMYSRVAYCR